MTDEKGAGAATVALDQERLKLHDDFVQAPDLGEILFQTRLQDAVTVCFSQQTRQRGLVSAVV